MAKKKAKSSTVSFGKSVSAATDEGQTTMFHEQHAEKDILAGEEVVIADHPATTPGTMADDAAPDARKMPRLRSHEPATSPYARGPVAIEVGPGPTTYWVPKHLLRSPKWSATDPGGAICLPRVSAATGHTLAHYLYTGTYQALEGEEEEEEDSTTPAYIKFNQAFLVFILASAYELQDLERLAKEQIEIHGSHLTLVEILETVRKEFSTMAWSWFHEYLKARTQEQFDIDYTFFTSGAFVESIGKGTLHRFITRHVLEMFSEKLTRTLEIRQNDEENRCVGEEEPDAVLDKIEDANLQTHPCSRCHGQHQSGMYTRGVEMSSEFPNASCENSDDVIALDNPSVPDGGVSDNKIEEAPYLELVEETIPEPESMPVPEAAVGETPPPNPEPPYPEPPVELESVSEKELAKEEHLWGFAATSTAKKPKKAKKDKKVQEEPGIEEALSSAAPELQPGSEPAPSETETEPIEENPAVDPFAGLNKAQTKKLQRKIEREARATEEEKLAELARQAEAAEVERIRLEEEEAECIRLVEEEVERIRVEEKETEKKHVEAEQTIAAAAAAAEMDTNKLNI